MDVYVIGAASSGFRRWAERSFRDLAAEVVRGAIADAGLPSAPLDGVWFGNCAMATWGQGNVRGQVTLAPLLRDGTLPADVPVVNVEGGCTTGGMALHAAARDLAAGADLALAVGVEKTFVPDDAPAILELFLHGADRHDLAWRDHVTAEAARVGDVFAPEPHRIPFVDVHALQARHHMRRHGTTSAQLAAIAAKNRSNGALNPLAQHRTALPVDQVLADRVVVAPFTRSMCAPISDGAAAILLCSGRFLATQPASVRDRAVRVRSTTLVGGTWRGLDDPPVQAHAAAKAWRASGLGPGDVDVVELHDATAFCELQAIEALGLCDVGQGGPFSASGATARSGEVPVNPSGGLESKGHPLAATGLGQVSELVRQLRGEAGDAQVPGAPAVGLAMNAGGLTALDEATCAVTVLERTR